MPHPLLLAFFPCTVFIPVRFNPANYTVKEGVDSNAVITLRALSDHPDFDFTVIVLTQDGSAIREPLLQLSIITYCTLQLSDIGTE